MCFENISGGSVAVLCNRLRGFLISIDVEAGCDGQAGMRCEQRRKRHGGCEGRHRGHVAATVAGVAFDFGD